MAINLPKRAEKVKNAVLIRRVFRGGEASVWD
jgi:hypothetical protein